MAKFTVGATYHFISFLIKNSIGNEYWSRFVWGDDEVKEIKIIKALCKEEHDVPWDQNPEGEKKYRGYVFEVDVDGAIGELQYPNASYGQISDVMDRVLQVVTYTDGKIVDVFEAYLLTSLINELELKPKTNEPNYNLLMDFIKDYLDKEGLTYEITPKVLGGNVIKNFTTCTIMEKA